jgi:hypothetical protein
MAEWRAIESAPLPTKIGEETIFLVWNGEDMWATRAYRWADGHVDMACHGCSGYDVEDAFANPTHWMPMPDPPT